MNNEISILISGSKSNSAVISQMFHGIIIAETEKAYQLQSSENSKATLWMPKKALVKKHDYFTIAKWFKPSVYQNNILCKYSRISGVSCA